MAFHKMKHLALGGLERNLDRVKWAGADIAEDDTERAERKGRGRAARIVRNAGAGLICFGAQPRKAISPDVLRSRAIFFT